MAAGVDQTMEALERALDQVNAWADSPGVGVAAPLALDEDSVLRVIRIAAAALSTRHGAVVFGMHLGASLARIVDDPSFGAGLARCRYTLSRDDVTVTCERAMGHDGEHQVTLNGRSMTGAEAARMMGA